MAFFWEETPSFTKGAKVFLKQFQKKRKGLSIPFPFDNVLIFCSGVEEATIEQLASQ